MEVISMEVGRIQSSQISVQRAPQTEKAGNTEKTENTEKTAANEKETGGKTENTDRQKYDAVSKDGDTLELGSNTNLTNKANLSTASTAKLKQMYSQKLISKAVYDKEMKKRASK